MLTAKGGVSVGARGVIFFGLLYALAFVDRAVITFLAGPLKADLGLTDIQLSLLFGASFTILYGLIGLPVSRAVDVGNRRLIVFAGVMIWGACTMGSGFATGFLMLFLLRVGLALGESVVSPAAYSLIGDWFPAQKRSFWASIFTWLAHAGSSVGMVLLSFVFALIIERHALANVPGLSAFKPWQQLFFVVGLPTIIVGFLLLVFVREPARPPVRTAQEDVTSFRAVLGHLGSHAQLYVGLLLGCGLNTMAMSAVGSWAPEMLRRAHGWDMSQAVFALGWAEGAAAILGMLLLPWFSDAMRRRTGRYDVPIGLAIVFTTVGSVLLAVAALQSSPIGLLVSFGVGQGLVIGSAMLVNTTLPVIVPPQMRAFTAALRLLAGAALTGTLAPLFVALLSTYVFDEAGARAISFGAATVALMTPLLTVSFLVMARKPFAAAMRSGLGEDQSGPPAAAPGSTAAAPSASSI